MNLSVIIPVYNVEATLDRCVASILRQDVPDMEVILVDDGSPDSCGRMCDDWASRDGRVRVIHQPNMGLCVARNAGLDIAAGRYVSFVDSDDYLMPDTLMRLVEMLDRHDCVDFVEFGVMHSGDRRHPLVLTDRIWRSAYAYWLDTMAWNHAYVCNKVFRRALFSGLRFTPGRLYEDLLLLPDLLHRAGGMATTGHVGYVYSDSQGSISNTVSLRSLVQQLRAELYALVSMRTAPWARNAADLYRAVCCRLYDIIRVGIFRKRL